MSFDKALQEEQELEKEFLSQVSNQEQKDDDQSNTSTNTDTETIETSTHQEDGVTTEEEVVSSSEETEEQKKDRVSWKERFSKYKAATDKTISSLRRDNSTFYRQLVEADKKIAELSKQLELKNSNSADAYNGLISDEEAELIGPEAAEIIKRAAKAISQKSAEPLQKEIEDLKNKFTEQKQQESQNFKKLKYDKFLSALQEVVPDFAVIDKDPRFNAFMNAIDPSTGEARIVDFKSAEEYYDVDRVSEFFLEYKRLVNAQVNKKVNLDNNVTPVTKAASSNNSQNKKDPEKITTQFIEKFFDDVSKGVYRNKEKEADRIEKLINDAYIAGNIID